ncbi:MAG TPA: nitroreductase family protein [Terriglobia bacterium]|nr:nitroreductase family protein [Terriglobia bacterium]
MDTKPTAKIATIDYGVKGRPSRESRPPAPQVDPGLSTRGVPDASVERLFQVAELSPTEWYFEPWRWIVVRSEAGKKLIASTTVLGTALATAPVVLICLADTAAWKKAPQRLLDLVAEKKMSEDALRDTLHRIREYYAASPQRAQRAALAHAYVTLHKIVQAATECHLSAYWVNAFDEQKIKTHFHVPDRYLVAALLGIGEGGATSLPAPKLPLESLVYSEKFGESFFPAPAQKPVPR